MIDATIVNTTNNSIDNSVGPITLNVPTNVDGDLLITFVTCHPSDTITVPSGWTLLARTNSSTIASIASYTRTAASEPASYNWSLDNARSFTVACTCVRNTDPSARVNINSGTGGSSLTTDMVGPTITTTRPKCLLLHAGVVVAASSTMTATPPSGMAEIVDKSSTFTSANRLLSVSWVLLGAAAATGTKTAVGSNSGAWAAQMIALNPVEDDIYQLERTLKDRFLNRLRR